MPSLKQKSSLAGAKSNPMKPPTRKKVTKQNSGTVEAPTFKGLEKKRSAPGNPVQRKKPKLLSFSSISSDERSLERPRTS